jgi:hypothetical protein
MVEFVKWASAVVFVLLLAVTISGMFYWVPEHVPEYMQTTISHALVASLAVFSTVFVYLGKFLNGTWTWITVLSVFVILAGIIALIVLMSLRIDIIADDKDKQDAERWNNLYLSIFSIVVLLSGILDRTLEDNITGIVGIVSDFASYTTGGGRRKIK